MDLSKFGLQWDGDLSGEIVDSEIDLSLPLLILFDENHAFAEGIRQSLINAINFYDSGLVDLIAVEGHIGPIRESLAKIAPEVNLDEVLAIIRMRRIPDDVLIQQSKAFADALHVLRPDAPIYGVEDAKEHALAALKFANLKKSVVPDALEQAKNLLAEGDFSPEKIQRWISSHRRETDSKILSTMNEMSAGRDAHFISNISKLRAGLSLTKATIFNAGKRHQDALALLLRRTREFAFIRIRPRGYPPSMI